MVDNYFRFRNDVLPVESQTLGASWSAVTRTFRIPKLADKITKARLMCQMSALSGGGGTYRRFSDYLGYALVDNIQLFSANNRLQYLTGDDLFLRNVKYMDTEQQDAENVLVAGNLSQSQRNSLATGVQELILDIPFYCFQQRGKALNPFQTAIEYEIRWRIKKLNDVIETDGTPAATLSEIKLRLETVHVEAAERDHITDLVQQQHGIVYKMDDHQRSAFTDGTTSATTSQKCVLDSHRGATKVLNFMVRTTSEINGTTTINRPYDNFHQVPAFRLTSAGGDEIVASNEDLYNRYVEFKDHYPAPAGKRIYSHSFCSHPSNHNDVTGTMNFGNINKPTLELQWGSQIAGAAVNAPASAYTVTVITEEHNFIQHSNGEIIQVISGN